MWANRICLLFDALPHFACVSYETSIWIFARSDLTFVISAPREDGKCSDSSGAQESKAAGALQQSRGTSKRHKTRPTSSTLSFISVLRYFKSAARALHHILSQMEPFSGAVLTRQLPRPLEMSKRTKARLSLWMKVVPRKMLGKWRPLKNTNMEGDFFSSPPVKPTGKTARSFITFLHQLDHGATKKLSVVLLQFVRVCHN